MSDNHNILSIDEIELIDNEVSSSYIRGPCHLVIILPGGHGAGGGEEPELVPAEAAQAGHDEDEGHQRHAAQADHHDLGLQPRPAPELTRGQTLQLGASENVLEVTRG